MKKHLSYARYVLRHKWFVFRAGIARSVPLWQLLVHDLSKFRPSEWRPYAEWFYGYQGGSWHVVLSGTGLIPTDRAPSGLAHRESPLGKILIAMAQKRNEAFMVAFLHHLHRSPHHWQHWVLTPDSQDRPTQVFEMPERYAREMLADWDGAGRAITGKWETPEWYAKRGPREKLHPNTRDFVERLLAMGIGVDP